VIENLDPVVILVTTKTSLCAQKDPVGKSNCEVLVP